MTMTMTNEVNHYNDSLAKALLKSGDTPLYLTDYVIKLLFGEKVSSWHLTDPEFKNSGDAKKSILDVLVSAKTAKGVYKIDIEVQSYRSSLVVRMHNYSRAMGTYDYINRKNDVDKLPVNIQLWMFKHANCATGIKFKGRKLVILDLMDVKTHQRYPFGDKFVLVNGDYYAKLKKASNDFDAIMRFFSISDNTELENFVTESRLESTDNLLAVQKYFFNDKDLTKAYMDREFELQELAKNQQKIDELNKALKAKDDALKAKDDALKAKDDALKAREARIKRFEEELAKKGITLDIDTPSD